MTKPYSYQALENIIAPEAEITVHCNISGIAIVVAEYKDLAPYDDVSIEHEVIGDAEHIYDAFMDIGGIIHMYKNARSVYCISNTIQLTRLTPIS